MRIDDLDNAPPVDELADVFASMPVNRLARSWIPLLLDAWSEFIDRPLRTGDLGAINRALLVVKLRLHAAPGRADEPWIRQLLEESVTRMTNGQQPGRS